MAQIITIPTPCHEDWNQMTPVEIGRHCAQCAKTVVDFTEKTQGEVLKYLETHKDQKTCGRFTQAQLQLPIPTPEDFVKKISWFRMSTLKKAAAIFIFAFMIAESSCNEPAQGKAVSNTAAITGDTVTINPAALTGTPVLPDSPLVKTQPQTTYPQIPDQVVGEPALPDTPKVKTPPKVKCVQTPDHIKGDVIYDSTAVMGAVAPGIKPAPVKEPVLIKPEPIIMGKMIMREEPKAPVVKKPIKTQKT